MTTFFVRTAFFFLMVSFFYVNVVFADEAAPLIYGPFPEWEPLDFEEEEAPEPFEGPLFKIEFTPRARRTVQEQELPPEIGVFEMAEDAGTVEKVSERAEEEVVAVPQVVREKKPVFYRERILPTLERALASWPAGDLGDRLFLRTDLEQKRYRVGDEIVASFRMVNVGNVPVTIQPNEGAIFVWVSGEVPYDGGESAEPLDVPYSFMVSGERFLGISAAKLRGEMTTEGFELGPGKSYAWKFPLNFKYTTQSGNEQDFWEAPQEVLLKAFYVKRKGEDQGTVAARPIGVIIRD